MLLVNRQTGVQNPRKIHLEGMYLNVVSSSSLVTHKLYYVPTIVMDHSKIDETFRELILMINFI